MRTITCGRILKLLVFTVLISYSQADDEETTKTKDEKNKGPKKVDENCNLKLEECGKKFKTCKSNYNKRIELYELLKYEYDMLISKDDNCKTMISECNIQNRDCNNEFEECKNDIKYMEDTLRTCNKETEVCWNNLKNSTNSTDVKTCYLYKQCKHETYDLKCKLRECQRKHNKKKPRHHHHHHHHNHRNKIEACHKHCHSKKCILELADSKFCKLHKCLEPAKDWRGIITDMTEREIFLYEAYLSEIAGQYDDMVTWMNRIACMDVELTDEERNYLWRAYKNSILKSRTEYEKIVQIEKDEKNGNLTIESPLAPEVRLEIISAYKDKIADELRKKCLDFMCILDKYPVTEDLPHERKGLYYLSRAFVESYLADFEVGEKRVAGLLRASNGFYIAGQSIGIFLATLDPGNPLISEYASVLALIQGKIIVF